MKGATIGVVICLVVAVACFALYFTFGKKKFDEKRTQLTADVQAQEARLKQIEGYKVEIVMLKQLLPRWKEQFEVFRAAIPASMEDDAFLRNISEQLRANGVRLMSVELAPAGQWFTNLNETQEANYEKENIKPSELRSVKIANFSMSLMGDFGNVLRSFENLKLYGRVYSIDKIISPSGGAGGAVFLNEEAGSTPIEVSGRIFYGLSEGYLSQQTLDEYFGQAEALGAAGDIYEAAIETGESMSGAATAAPAAAAGQPAEEAAAEEAAGDTAAASEDAESETVDTSARTEVNRHTASAQPSRNRTRLVAAGG